MKFIKGLSSQGSSLHAFVFKYCIVFLYLGLLGLLYFLLYLIWVDVYIEPQPIVFEGQSQVSFDWGKDKVLIVTFEDSMGVVLSSKEYFLLERSDNSFIEPEVKSDDSQELFYQFKGEISPGKYRLLRSLDTVSFQTNDGNQAKIIFVESDWAFVNRESNKVFWLILLLVALLASLASISSIIMLMKKKDAFQ